MLKKVVNGAREKMEGNDDGEEYIYKYLYYYYFIIDGGRQGGSAMPRLTSGD